jgi:KaiC/GvpD/RAD55 family RecA-like ATPase
MEDKKQKLLLEYLISSPDTFALCTSIVVPDYFTPELRNTVKFVQQYYDSYNSLPSPQQIQAETDIELGKHEITRDQIEYCANEIEAFCKQSAIEKAILKSPELIEQGKYGEVEQLIKDAVTISLNRDIGLEYFENVRERLERMEKESERLPTGWSQVDEILFGGHARKELLVFSANSGVGKSVALANYGLNQAELGLNVLYISLELSEDLLAQRYDTMISSVSTAIWKLQKEKIVQAVEKKAQESGKITVKRMNSGTTPRDIRAYLKEFELKQGYVPDVLIVDYLDIMGSNERISADNVFEKDKRAAEQLRDIGNDYNMAVATASQQNRSAVDELKINQSHVAGGISKINTSDTWISIVATETMKAQEICKFQFIKTRTSNGVGKQITLKWQSNIRIVDDEDSVIETFVQKDNASNPVSFMPGNRGLSFADASQDVNTADTGEDSSFGLDDAFNLFDD